MLFFDKKGNPIPEPLGSKKGTTLSYNQCSTQGEFLSFGIGNGAVGSASKEELRKKNQMSQYIKAYGYVTMIRESILNGNCKLVLSDIISYHDNGHEYYKTNVAIGNHLGIRVGTAKAILRKLKTMGLILMRYDKESQGNEIRYITPKIQMIKRLC